MTLLRRLVPVALLLTLTACGPGGSGAAAAPTTMSNAGVLALGRQIAQCIRDHGIPDFPDPVVDEHGQLQMPSNSTEDELKSRYSQATLDQAQQACQSLFDQLPQSAVSGGGNEPDTPGPQDVDALRRWAECARQNGFPDWPDPNADGSFPRGRTPLETEGKSARIQQLFQTCKQYWDGGFSIR
jgi:hypothetical protein